ncbi:MAG: SLC13 family permease [Hyphomicrobiales bacterium]|nr:SLC13 family permease [Hyphomicrobiales bacterium]
MTQDQIILFCIFALAFGFLIWGRWRYDLVAFIALIVALIAGVVPKEQAFSGFGHPAVIIIALVLVTSRGLYASGVIDLLMRLFADGTRSLAGHIAIMAGIGAALSAVMNNVAALALLMPADIQAAVKAKRSPALSLMPLSFATILGGMITLIGTPPNIVIAAYREQALGRSYAMFDFAPVGLACAAVGVVFVALVGWRLIPSARGEHDTTKELFELEGYIAELTVSKGSSAVGKVVAELDEIADEADCVILGLVRKGKRLPGQARRTEIRAGDILVIEAAPEGINELVGKLKLEIGGQKKSKEPAGGDMALMEMVVPRDARVEGRSALSLSLLARHGITLLGVSRRGKRFRERVRKLEIQAGDVLLLLGPNERLQEIAGWLGGLPLAGRGLQLIQRDKAWLAAGIFAAAILLATFGLLDLPVALAAAVVLYVLFNVVPLRELYESIEWPVIVLLASLIPIGAALETSGGTALIAQGIVLSTQGYSPVVVLGVLMIVTMTLSDVLNNTATAVVTAPIAVDISRALDVNPDPFLMAVAVASSCAFLTPIGHKNNTLILGPGGYQFGDYWRMGLPLEIIVIAVGVPMILWVWPL